MRYRIARSTARIVRLFLIGGVAMLLPAACAPLAPQFPVKTSMSSLSSFEHGEVVLNCRMACAAAWNSNRPDMLRRYIAGNWRGLADLVIDTGFQNDLAYFYLGRAAEGLGKNEAALNYYRVAGALATGPDQSLKCRDGAGSCEGFSFPNELYDRIRTVKVAMGRIRPKVARHSPAGPQTDPAVAEKGAPVASAVLPVPPPGASPSGDAWVDPPPVTH